MELGRLEKIELREIWRHEALDFTRWLAKKENIALLSKEIGIDIEVIETEMSVGRYNVDIFARDIESNKKIVIENQLENTNHDHLGKMLVYAAGLDADIAIWVVKDVNEEHKQAVEWLNDNSFEKINIFLVKVELWQIDNSPVAPKFQVICEPNNWAKVLKQQSKDNITDLELKQMEYWQGFVDYAKSKDKTYISQRPSMYNWYVIRIGSSDYKIKLVHSVNSDMVKCQLEIFNDEIYKKLEQYRNEIDNKINDLEWEYLEDRKVSRIGLSNNIKDSASSYVWLLNMVDRFKEVFLDYLNK
ncbi:DUF4268 domain-containing protein [Romboutsia ilealis]|uniref:DUF4268 domain-containing protein n=1 Tax=Romboutsia ilealis TaxID=1115758 RepID=UPI00249406EC|nr:DUF4268 domain-containing protein [Romboutsia ilealis]